MYQSLDSIFASVIDDVAKCMTGTPKPGPCPEGDTGAGGGAATPSEAKPASDTPAESEVHQAWQKRNDSRDNRRASLDQAEEIATQDATERYASIKQAHDSLLQGEGDPEALAKAVAEYQASESSRLESVLGTLKAAGASDEESEAVKEAAAKALGKVAKVSEKYAAAAQAAHEADAAFTDLEANEPDTSELDEEQLPEEPQEPEEPDPPTRTMMTNAGREMPYSLDAEPERKDYEGEGSDEEYQKDHDDWKAWDKVHGPWEKAHEKWETAHERWDEKCDNLRDKHDTAVAKAHEKWETAMEKAEEKKDTAWERFEGLGDDLVAATDESDEVIQTESEKVSVAVRDRIEDEETDDEEPVEEEEEPEDDDDEVEKMLATILDALDVTGIVGKCLSPLQPGPCPEGGGAAPAASKPATGGAAPAASKPATGGGTPAPHKPASPKQVAEIHTQAGEAAKTLGAKLKQLPGHIVKKALEKVTSSYKKLESKYGRGWAIAIVGAGIIGSLGPIPGMSLVAAAPVLAAAHIYTKMRATTPETAKAVAGLSVEQLHRLGKAFIAELLAGWQEGNDTQTA